MELPVTGFSLAYAEIALASGICLVLVVDMLLGARWRSAGFYTAMLTLVVTAWFSAGIGLDGRVTGFSGVFVVDPLARLLKLTAVAVVALVFVYSRGYLRARGLDRPEYYLMGLFATLGILVMVSSYSLLMLYLGLELMSLALYVMVAFDRNSAIAAESAMKYFVLGAVASGMLLYGMSLLYGVTGSLQLETISRTLAAMESAEMSVLLAVAFIVAGVAFKFGAVPFHMWVPDVYEGAPTAVTLFVGTAPKLAAFAMAARLLVDGLGPEAVNWQAILVALSVLSLAIGNIVAIAQTNLKRMLAYSTIAHVGFILLGFAAGTAAGRQAALFYTIVYVVMAAGAFGMIILLSRRGFESEEIEDLKGLNARSPWFAGIMLLLMVSLIGIPPFAGFFAKLNILAALVDGGEVWLAVVAVLFSVIGAFYYLRVIRYMYFDEGGGAGRLEAGWDLRLLVSLNGLAVLALGLFANGLLEVCAAAIG